MTLDKSAKVAGYDDLLKLEKILSKIKRSYTPEDGDIGCITDIGQVAAACGYDAIDAKGNYVILNRTKVILSWDVEAT